MIPEGSPVAWFPPRVSDFFKARGVDKAAARLNSETPEKTMVGFRRLAWSVELVKIDFIPFATALAQLENEEPLLEIASIHIEAMREDAESQRVLLTLHNIVTK